MLVVLFKVLYLLYEPVNFYSSAFLVVGFPCLFGNSLPCFFFCCFPFHLLSNIPPPFSILMTMFVSRNCQVYHSFGAKSENYLL